MKIIAKTKAIKANLVKLFHLLVFFFISLISYYFELMKSSFSFEIFTISSFNLKISISLIEISFFSFKIDSSFSLFSYFSS
jgi:hypothetical protein